MTKLKDIENQKTVNFEILRSRDIEILSLGVKNNVE